MHREWLEHEIAHQLSLAHVWLKTTDRTRNDPLARVYEHTGSCLRVVVGARRSLSSLPTAQVQVRTVVSLPAASHIKSCPG